MVQQLVAEKSFSHVVLSFEKFSDDGFENVKFVYNALKSRQLLPTPSQFKFGKDDGKALQMRKKGNIHFVDLDYVGALDYYNRCLAFSTASSENLGLAYANRSAVYFNCGYYDECLENIELAIKHNYPERLMEKLLNRKEECEKRVNRIEGKVKIDAPPKVTLTDKANPMIPSVINGIKLAHNKNLCYHLVATRDLRPGDVIMIEKPYMAIFHTKALYSYCSNCYESNMMNLMPCETSTHAMFCSRECYDKFWNRFFKYEAPITQIYYEMSELLLSDGRLGLIGLGLFGNIEKLKEFVEKTSSAKQITAFELDYTSDMAPQNLFGAVYSQPTRDNWETSLHKFVQVGLAAVNYHILTTFTDLKDMIHSDEDEQFVMGYAYQLRMNLSCWQQVLMNRSGIACKCPAYTKETILLPVNLKWLAWSRVD